MKVLYSMPEKTDNKRKRHELSNYLTIHDKVVIYR